MNIRALREAITQIAEHGIGEGGAIRLHPSRDVVVRVEDEDRVRWLAVDGAEIAFVNGRFVLQLAAGARDGEPGVHW